MGFVQNVVGSFLRKSLFSEGLVSKKYAVNVLLDCFESAVSVRWGGDRFGQEICFEAGRVAFLPGKEGTVHVLKKHCAIAREEQLLSADQSQGST